MIVEINELRGMYNALDKAVATGDLGHVQDVMAVIKPKLDAADAAKRRTFLANVIDNALPHHCSNAVAGDVLDALAKAGVKLVGPE